MYFRVIFGRTKVSKSIIHNKCEGTCYICSRFFGDFRQKPYLEEHHVFGGPNRKISEHYGMKVYLCKKHHTGDIDGEKDAVHRPDLNEYNDRLHIIAQREFEKLHTHEEFMKKFGRNYL